MTILFGLLGVWGACNARDCHAQISFLNMDRNNTYIQSGDSIVNYNGSFFDASLNSTNPGDFDGVVLDYPGAGSPVNVPPLSPGVFLYGTPTLPSQAAMDSAYPFGTYAFTADGNMGPANASFPYSSDAYSLTTPSLVGGTFSGLQGMNSLQPFTVQFSPFVADPNATQTFIFFSIYESATQNVVFNEGFLPGSTPSLTIPAGVLSPSVSYGYELIFSDRETVPSPGATFDAQILFDTRTDGSFTTVPEPSSFGMLIAGTLGLAVATLRRRLHRSGH